MRTLRKPGINEQKRKMIVNKTASTDFLNGIPRILGAGRQYLLFDPGLKSGYRLDFRE
jgi:hypothetical protein